MGVEMFLVRTVVSSWEKGRRGTPPIWVDCVAVGEDVGRNFERPPLPEPNLDAVFLATCEGIESTSNRVETFAIRIRVVVLGSATLIVVVIGVAICRGGHSASTLVSRRSVGWRRRHSPKLESIIWHGTIRRGVERDQVLSGLIHALSRPTLTQIDWSNRNEIPR